MNASGSLQKIRVRQIRSCSGRTEPERDTLRALGLGSIGKEKVHNATASVLGMMRKVEHVISVSPAE